MKYKITFFLFIVYFLSYSQLKEGQTFCDEMEGEDYFSIKINKKIILWSNTYYIETIEGKKTINGKVYNKYKQSWYKSDTYTLFLREDKGVIYQYEECCDAETIRYDKTFKKGFIWKTADDKGEYKIISYNGKLKTPYCEYSNLLVIEAKLDFGNYKFYYLRGFGYIGATKEGEIISCLAPKIPKRFK